MEMRDILTLAFQYSNEFFNLGLNFFILKRYRIIRTEFLNIVENLILFIDEFFDRFLSVWVLFAETFNVGKNCKIATDNSRLENC